MQRFTFRGFPEALVAAVALTVSGILEGLSAVVTVTLDSSVYRKARSKIVGIESGLNSVFPSFGIYILRVGLDLPLMNRPFTKSKRAAGDSDLIPSTPQIKVRTQPGVELLY